MAQAVVTLVEAVGTRDRAVVTLVEAVGTRVEAAGIPVVALAGDMAAETDTTTKVEQAPTPGTVFSAGN